MKNRAGLPVLMFHSFAGENAVNSVDPSWFDETLAMLAEAEFRCVDLDDWVTKGRPDEPKGYAIAIDDGLRSIGNIVDSLSRHHATATMFLVTGRVGTDNAWPGQPSWIPFERLLSWQELDGLKPHGIKFAAHGVSHVRLDHCTPARIETELRASRDAIEERIGTACRIVAYPYGHANQRVREIASRYFEAGFGTRLDFADATQDPWDLARVDAYYLRSDPLRRSLIVGESRGPLRWRRTLRSMKKTAVGAFWRSESL